MDSAGHATNGLQRATMNRTIFIICPICRKVIGQRVEEGISNTYEVAQEPCSACVQKPTARRYPNR